MPEGVVGDGPDERSQVRSGRPGYVDRAAGEAHVRRISG